MAAFQRVAAWRMGEDELVLADSDEHELLRLRAATPEGSWLATGLLRESDNTLVSPLAGTEITAVLDEDGALAGSTGCNRYTTTYTAERGSIEIAPPTVTELACTEPDGVMEQESAYLALLARVERYRVDSASLALLDTDGTTLVTFQRAQR
jgi:heat shock protein HslJ